jgi:hypothetical protein
MARAADHDARVMALTQMGYVTIKPPETMDQ